jgi:Kef-type K+ transport system membrane component KefB
MHLNILTQIGIAIVAATAFAFLAKYLRQPLILGYMAAGVLIGPTEGFGWISPHEIEAVSELGLILLLFMIGLEIDLKKVRKAGAAVVASGVGQFVICVGLGLLVAPWLGFARDDKHAALYWAVTAALSSTMIVVKLLYDKFELATQPGRITLGILVFQDLWAILFLALQAKLDNPAPLVLLLSLVKGAGMVAFALLVSRYLLPVAFRSIAKLPELMLIGALGWCFGIALLAEWLGLSREMGALIAGISLSTFPYSLDVVAKVISLRDFFITLFFVTLGTRIPRPSGDVLGVALLGSAFLIGSRFLSITPILAALRKGNRVAFIPALNLSQISEFSLVIGALGISYGHVDERFLSILVYVFVITSLLSTYGILYNYEVFTRVNPLLKRLGLRDLGPRAGEEPAREHKPVVLLGFAHDASSLLHELLAKDPALAERITVVDFNPEVKKELDRRGIDCIYGDISHAGTLHHAGVEHARVLVCTVADMLLKGTSNARLLRQLGAVAPTARIIVTAGRFGTARELYRAGAAFVYMPRLMSARELRDIVLSALEGDLEAQRHSATAELEARTEVLP